MRPKLFFFFSFAEDGTVVRPETNATEPYPGYHADRTRRQEYADSLYFQRFPKSDKKPWKNVAITEQDDAAFEAFEEMMQFVALCEWRPDPALYAHAMGPSTPDPIDNSEM